MKEIRLTKDGKYHKFIIDNNAKYFIVKSGVLGTHNFSVEEYLIDKYDRVYNGLINDNWKED